MMFGAVAALVATLLGGATCGGKKAVKPDNQPDSATVKPTAEAPQRAEFDLVFFGRTLGTIAPCGCTTEPLGGLQYAFGWLNASTQSGARLIVEPGSFLYPDPAGPHAVHDDAGWNQAESRADLLTGRFSALGSELVSGLGPFDLTAPTGVATLARHPLPRVAANLTPKDGIEVAKHRVVELRASTGLTWKVGVTEVLDPSLPGVEQLGVVGPAEPAAAEQLTRMRAAGAGLAVVIAHGPRSFAETIAREVEGVDLVVVGVVEGTERQRLGSPAARVGATWVVEPGEQLQTLTHVELSVAPGFAAVPGVERWTLRASREDTLRELARVEERLTKFVADPKADPQFVATLQRERERLLAAVDGAPDAPASVTFEQVKVTCKLPVDPAAQQLLAGYDQAVAATNRSRFAGVKPPPPAKGKAGYVGVAECGDCHEEAVQFWETTVHARAWETLVEDKKEFDVTCVGCHVTGFRKPGGSEVIENQGLRDVQCEVCHGPGSLHVEDAGDDLKLIELHTPATLCATECHTPEHSDTFDYVPYLRDILGPGHGEAARKALGPGATGAELRKAGIAKAGGACKQHM